MTLPHMTRNFTVLTKLDLLYQSFNEDWLSGEVGECYGPKIEVQCKLFYGRNRVSARPLSFIIQPYSTPKSELGPHKVTTVDAFDSYGSPILSQSLVLRYVIVQDSIPSVEDLLDWAKLDSDSVEGSMARFMFSLAFFMEEYCKHQPQLPLVRP